MEVIHALMSLQIGETSARVPLSSLLGALPDLSRIMCRKKRNCTAIGCPARAKTRCPPHARAHLMTCLRACVPVGLLLLFRFGFFRRVREQLVHCTPEKKTEGLFAGLSKAVGRRGVGVPGGSSSQADSKAGPGTGAAGARNNQVGIVSVCYVSHGFFGTR